MNDDLLNVIGSFSETALDCIGKQNEEIEELEKENTKLKEVIEEIREVINKMISTGYADEEYMYMATYERSEFGVRAKVILQILDKYKK